MLSQLTVRNFALIESAKLEFTAGFNVLTGETGAGKSILIDAIEAVLGGRLGSGLIRAGADRAFVEAVFDVSDCALPGVREWAEDDLIVLCRDFGPSGRSNCRINGRICSASTVRGVAGDLLDIHGQHEHQSLLSPDRHVDFLDAWAGDEVRRARDETVRLHLEFKRLLHERTDLKRNSREQAQLLDLLRFQADEIDRAELGPGEEAEIIALRDRLAHAEKLSLAVESARARILDKDPSPVDELYRAARELEPCAQLDPTVQPMIELLTSAAAMAEDAAQALRSYLEQIEVSPERLAEVMDRLETYRLMKRKYGDSTAEVLAFRESLAVRLEGIESIEERQLENERLLESVACQLARRAQDLYQLRSLAAERLALEIRGHLSDLRMAPTRFVVQVSEPGTRDYGDVIGPQNPEGRAEFLISANPGEPLRPLVKVASGGEISRVMLALKSALAGSHPVALIFDEIDTGVGGRTAEALGAKMAELARSNQVLCVTHLPQIACLADRHILVSKSVEGERTSVSLTALDGDSRVDELARMLGGAQATAEGHARQLLAAGREAGRGRLSPTGD